MNDKTLGVIAYLTVIGWIIAFISYRNSDKKSDFVRYHLGQSLGIILISIAISIISGVLVFIIPALSTVFYIIALAPYVFMLLGVVTALNETMRPLPLIGKYFEHRFSF